jgi:hypothetical protein
MRLTIALLHRDNRLMTASAHFHFLPLSACRRALRVWRMARGRAAREMEMR